MIRRAESSVLGAVAGRRPNRAGWVRVNCPLCEEATGKKDSGQSFGLHDESGFWRCFRCGTKGRLGGRSGDLRAVPKTIGPVKISPPDGFFRLSEEPGASAVSLLPARCYLRKRRVSSRAAREAGVGACASGRYAGRVIVPVADPGGDGWVGFVARSWGRESERRYLYPEGMARGEAVFNAGVLARRSDDPVLVVEGVFDALPHWPRAVALLGKPSGKQVHLLARARCPLVVALDGDAWEEGRALAMMLRVMGVRAWGMRLPPRADPGDLDRGALWTAAVRCVSMREEISYGEDKREVVCG